MMLTNRLTSCSSRWQNQGHPRHRNVLHLRQDASMETVPSRTQYQNLHFARSRYTDTNYLTGSLRRSRTQLYVSSIPEPDLILFTNLFWIPKIETVESSAERCTDFEKTHNNPFVWTARYFSMFVLAPHASQSALAPSPTELLMSLGTSLIYHFIRDIIPSERKVIPCHYFSAAISVSTKH